MPKVLVIAEAGVNHNGEMDMAKKLVDAAVSAGADYVKFQTFKAEKIASKNALKAGYQQQQTGGNEGQLEMLRRLELTEEAHFELMTYSAGKGIRFLSTAFDLDSIDLLKRLNIRLGKIPSGEITNLPYLRKMARSFDELILSTGMTEMHELEEALNVLVTSGMALDKISILHCNTEYPTPFEDVNLLAMHTIREKFNVNVGYSDHTLGIEVPIAAVALGASIIEKHFTLDKELPGPDHKASLDPFELKQMVTCIRNIEKALGTDSKIVTASELKNRVNARKSIVAATDIKAGDEFSERNLAVKRPGDGISPMKWDLVIGRVAKRDFLSDEAIEL
jgi:N,N'-diacetyllegionaminate synthase